MRRHAANIRDIIIRLVDVFYPPFRNLMSLQTFRYAACGGVNTLFDIALYFITYHYVVQEKIIYTPLGAISPYIAALIITFPISFLTGFLLMRYVVFPDSKGTRKRIQVSKYLVVVFLCILLNYIFLKLFVERFGWWPLPAKIMTTVLVVAFSYYSQKYFTFRQRVVRN